FASACFFFNDTATTEIYTLSLHDALPILGESEIGRAMFRPIRDWPESEYGRSEEHTSELQSHVNLVCRLLLEKKKTDGVEIFVVSGARDGLGAPGDDRAALCVLMISSGGPAPSTARAPPRHTILFFFNDTGTPEIYTLPPPDPFPI